MEGDVCGEESREGVAACSVVGVDLEFKEGDALVGIAGIQGMSGADVGAAVYGVEDASFHPCGAGLGDGDD
ncbi:hypothetical protein OPV22_004174 [Ensete ventricosum]|uniref:Uncharacterized protein n=1 Tax=Ensete ventricosum TaxID=4639 RepID=A0AAV8S301_ENSVE|nr:hypothetical protein OPV22_004174 [Ensete ventricosum]